MALEFICVTPRSAGRSDEGAEQWAEAVGGVLHGGRFVPWDEDKQRRVGGRDCVWGKRRARRWSHGGFARGAGVGLGNVLAGG